MEQMTREQIVSLSVEDIREQYESIILSVQNDRSICGRASDKDGRGKAAYSIAGMEERIRMEQEEPKSSGYVTFADDAVAELRQMQVEKAASAGIEVS